MLKTALKNNGKTDKRKRKVHWSKEVVDKCAEHERICLFKKQKLPLSRDFDRLWQRIHRIIKNGQWKKLHFFFKTSQIDEVVLRDFFLSKGHDVFRKALSFSKVYYQTFILNEIPRDCAKQILAENNFHILSDFLSLQGWMEANNWYTDEIRAVRVKALEFLLKVDREGVSKFIKENESASYINDAVQEEYKQALSCLEVEGAAINNGNVECSVNCANELH